MKKVRRKPITHIAPLLILFLLLAVRTSYAVRITSVRHLFDITSDFNTPSDVSVSTDGKIFVVDGVNNVVKAFSSNGKFLFAFGEKGADKGQFNTPLGIDIDKANKVYVADSRNHRVQVFDASGNFISKIDIPSGSVKPADPTDVVVDSSSSKCYVIDNDNHRILIYSLGSFKLLATFGKPGMEPKEFRYPFLAALDLNKNLCVVDVLNTRVQVLGPDGHHVSTIGNWGVEKGEFFRPKGVAVDKGGRVYVSDSFLGVVQVFKENRDFNSIIGDEAHGVKKFNTPVGLAVHDDRLYVVEMVANKVSVYAINQDVEVQKKKK